MYFREELRGISRGKDAKDVDWSEVAGSVVIEETEKPEPIKISLSDVLQRVKKPHKTKHIIKSNAALDKNSKFSCKLATEIVFAGVRVNDQ